MTPSELDEAQKNSEDSLLMWNILLAREDRRRLLRYVRALEDALQKVDPQTLASLRVRE